MSNESKRVDKLIRPDSPYWDFTNGVCTKHLLPCVPCPSCMAKDDPDIFEAASAMELLMWDDMDSLGS